MAKGICFCFLVLKSLLPLLLFIVDVVLDVWAVVSLYKEQNYVSMGVLIFLLLASSVLLQIFSWIWYSEYLNKFESKIETFISKHGLLALVHFLQLGVFLRILADVEISIFVKPKQPQKEVNSTPDLILLRLFEAFSESAPQLVLMMVLIMQMPELHLFTVAKIAGSLSCMAFSMLSFHRNMREYVSKELEIGWFSLPTVTYFLWNLFVIGPRMVCLSLFASIMPCYIAAHFLSLWTLLVVWAWWQKTGFMDTKPGEWLYRATVGIIWYFNWFNVTNGNTKLKGIIYSMVMGADTLLLLGLWWWRRSVESARLSPLPINPYVLIGMLITIYIIGVALKLFYYWKFNPEDKDVKLDKTDHKRLRCEVQLKTLELQCDYRHRIVQFENMAQCSDSFVPVAAATVSSEGETEASETLTTETVGCIDYEGERKVSEILHLENAIRFDYEDETKVTETLHPETASLFDYEGDTKVSETLDPESADGFSYEGERKVSETLEPETERWFNCEDETKVSERPKPKNKYKHWNLDLPETSESAAQKRMKKMVANFYG